MRRPTTRNICGARMLKSGKKKTRAGGPRVEAGSANVFADLGFRNPNEMVVKAELTRYLNSIIDARGYTQVELAGILGIHQPKVSVLRRGRLTEFSLETLMRFLVALGQAVEINVHEAKKRPGVRVMHAKA